MGAAVRFRVDPRLVPVRIVARLFGLQTDDFRMKLAELRGLGFPSACPVTGHFDLKAIEAWLDRRAGLTPPDPMTDSDAIIRERLEKAFG